ncbi:MAG: undecaprenyldiphospho-muramoylpentapeptide beta-N-acetylglucosaminyltransferase [Candidatus Omnitrophota bacterium]
MKVLIACGGTGGHIFPGLSLYDALKAREGVADILLVVDKREISSFIVPENYPHVYVCLVPLKFNFNLQGLTIVLKLVRGILQSAALLLKFRPDVVVGFGGYASFFIVFFAGILGIKTLIHEPNVAPGRANLILAYFTDKISCGFGRTRDRFGRNSFKAELTGNPLRPSLNRIEKKRACGFFGLQWDRFTILVMGGSQGAHKINTVFFQAVSLLEEKSKFQVIHLCGRQDEPFLKGAYGDSGVRAEVFPYLAKMEYAYSAADMVISRSGAISITEFAFFGLPAVFIPYPYVRAHQLENALLLLRNNAAAVIEEENLNPEILKEKISQLFNNPALRSSMGKNLSKFSKPGADKALAELALNV